MDKNTHLNWAVARVLKEARIASGLSQAELAGFSALSEQYVSKAERGTTGSSINALMQLASVLAVPASELLRRVEEELARGPQAPETEVGRPRKGRKKKN